MRFFQSEDITLLVEKGDMNPIYSLYGFLYWDESEEKWKMYETETTTNSNFEVVSGQQNDPNSHQTGVISEYVEPSWYIEAGNNYVHLLDENGQCVFQHTEINNEEGYKEIANLTFKELKESDKFIGRKNQYLFCTTGQSNSFFDELYFRLDNYILVVKEATYDTDFTTCYLLDMDSELPKEIKYFLE